MALLNVIPGLDDRNIHQVTLNQPGQGQGPGGPTRPPQLPSVYTGLPAAAGLPDANVDYSQVDPFIRDVQDDELVQNQLTGLLASDSDYMRNARQRGAESAAQRGALNSSIFAGASQRAAIEAAAPIAQADAQAYRQAATENAAAINQHQLAKMQSMTSLASSRIGAAASIMSTEISANANKEIARMNIDFERDAMEFQAGHDAFMENLRFGNQYELQDFAQQHNIDMTQLQFAHETELQELGHRYALDQMDFQGSVNSYLQNQQTAGSFMSNTLMGSFDSIAQLNSLDLDSAGYQRGVNGVYGLMGSMFDAFNFWASEGNMPDIVLGGG